MFYSLLLGGNASRVLSLNPKLASVKYVFMSLYIHELMKKVIIEQRLEVGNEVARQILRERIFRKKNHHRKGPSAFSVEGTVKRSVGQIKKRKVVEIRSEVGR